MGIISWGGKVNTLEGCRSFVCFFCFRGTVTIDGVALDFGGKWLFTLDCMIGFGLWHDGSIRGERLCRLGQLNGQSKTGPT